MTEIYGLFDAADPEAPDRVYTSEAFARLFKTMMRDGIVHNDGDELAVGPTVPAAMSVSVGTGMALIQGRYYINDGDLALNVEAAGPSLPRIDRVVVRLEATPGRTIHAVVKKGTPAPSPVPPGLTRTAETWELSLAQIFVAAGATMVQAANITDERGNTSLCGVAAPVYVPSSQVEVVGAMNMQGHALTGLPAPSGATDAARKGYVDTEIAGAIGGFGISQIAIDADKNWNGKSITNIGGISGAAFTPNVADMVFIHRPDPNKNPRNIVASDLSEVTTHSDSFILAKTFPAAPATGFIKDATSAVTVSFEICSWDLDWKAEVEIRVGDEVRGGPIQGPSSSYVERSVDVEVQPGEVLTIWLRTGHSIYEGKVRNVKIYSMRHPLLAPSVAW